MIQAISNVAPSVPEGMRNLFAGRRATLFGALGLATSAAAALPTAAVAAPHPDADLMLACSEFISLNRRHAEILDSFGDEGDDAAEVAWAPYHEQQALVLGRMMALRAVTPDGVLARALAYVNYCPDAIEPRWLEDYVDTRQMFALLRDAAAIGAVL